MVKRLGVRGQSTDARRQKYEIGICRAACDEPFGCELKVERLSRVKDGFAGLDDLLYGYLQLGLSLYYLNISLEKL